MCCVKFSQSARLYFLLVRFDGLLSGLWRVCVMRICMRSGDRSCVALQEERRARSGEAKEMSGEVWLVLVLNDYLVGESVLLMMLRRGSWFSTSEYCMVSKRCRDH